MNPIDSLDALTLTSGDAGLHERVKALSHCFSALHTGEDVRLVSIYAGKASPLSNPELDGLPPARRWIPEVDAEGYPALFFNTELDLAERTAGAIERAAGLAGIPLAILERGQGPGDALSGRNLSDTLISALNNEWTSSRLCELYWKDQRIGHATRAIYGLSLESDNYLVFVGPGDLGAASVVFLGEQPFEGLLYAKGTPKPAPLDDIAELAQVNAHRLEAHLIAQPVWWDDMVDDGLHTLLRATFLQMAIPGESLDIATPEQAPRWRHVPLLGQPA